VAGIVYAQLPSLPSSASPWVKTAVIWTGWDGSIWDLTSPESGVVLINQGVEGLHMPKFKQWTRQSPAVPGQTFTGMVAEPRSVVLPLLVFEDASSIEWVHHDRAFWKSLHPGKEGILTVSPAGGGSRRSLRLRLVPEDHSFDMDPSFAGWAQYVVMLVADNPFWAGLPIRGSWGNGSAEEFYEETGPQLVNITSGHTTANAYVRNDGDENVWPVWTIIGAATAAHVGVGGNVVEIPFTVAAGKALVLDTDPRVQTALEYDYTPPAGNVPEAFTDPVDRTTDLIGAVDFAPVPAGGGSALNVNITGNGTVRVEIIPLYWRAW
jgi:hypothetical protein